MIYQDPHFSLTTEANRIEFLQDVGNKSYHLQSMGLVRIGQVMRKSRLRWYGHVARREETHWLQRILNFPVPGRKPRGRPRKTWGETIKEDRRASNITHIDPTDRTAWRRAIKEMNCPTPQSGKNGLQTIMMMMMMKVIVSYPEIAL